MLILYIGVHRLPGLTRLPHLCDGRIYMGTVYISVATMSLHLRLCVLFYQFEFNSLSRSSYLLLLCVVFSIFSTILYLLFVVKRKILD